MRRLLAFLHVSADGYFAGPGGDLSWAKHEQDPEYKEFADGNARREGVMLFGRVTYQMMAGFWPSPMALEREPVMAPRMNERPKIVFSRSLSDASWNNTTLLKGDVVVEVRALKQQSGADLVILGSGTIVKTLAQAGLVDEFQLLITPVVLGSGRTLFEGIPQQLALDLVATRAFKNGKVLLTYAPKP
ncbi:MAG: dihydrofolate reductase [Acidobacteria bacterium]|nr:dihydrofolate reductase [Acidobacteriota bacterium]